MTTTTCDPAVRVTRSLLGYGVIAGPVYVVTSVTQALTRTGFDLTRHSWSLLANGPLGWIQITNFIVTGLMVGAAAAGLHRALPGSWAPRLVAVFGLSLIAAGLFRADPMAGFPAGTPAGPGPVSWHGVLHLAAAGIGFTCLSAACLVLGRRFARAGRRGWAMFSRLAGVLFLAGFAIVATGGPTLAFVAAVLLVLGWLTAVSLHLYRHV